MCEFVSWIELKKPLVTDNDDLVLFLTTDHLKDKKGRKTAKRRGNDINGHGAIREYYDLPPGAGADKECTDFSTPDNFPAQIVDAIKDGKMRGFGLDHGLLTPAALAEYDKVRQSALAEYRKVERPALAEYKKVEQPALAEHIKVQQHTFWGLFKKQENRAEAWR